MDKQALVNCFANAREKGCTFVFVVINAEGTDEVVAVPKQSFDEKEAFYLKAYDYNLHHVMNSKVYIRGLSFGEAEELNRLV